MTASLGDVIPSYGADTLTGFDTSNVQDGRPLKGIKRQHVRFFKKKEIVIAADKVEVNEKTGAVRVLKTKPIEVEREWVLIVTPGDKNRIETYAEEFHKREYPREYAAFRQGRAAPLGTAIDECTYISASVATELKYQGVHSEEQLADAADYLCGIIADGFNLREFARAACKVKSENQNIGAVSTLKTELEKSQSVIEKLQEEMAQMRGMLLNAQGEVVATPEVEPMLQAMPEAPKKRGK